MSYRTVKCWYCGEVPHPLDIGHAAYCSRMWLQRQQSKDPK